MDGNSEESSQSPPFPSRFKQAFLFTGFSVRRAQPRQPFSSCSLPRSSQCASLVPEEGNSPGQTRVAAVTGKALGRFSLQLLSVPRPQIPSHTFQLSFPAPCCDSLSAHPLHISAHKSRLVTGLSTSARWTHVGSRVLWQKFPVVASPPVPKEVFCRCFFESKPQRLSKQNYLHPCFHTI